MDTEGAEKKMCELMMAATSPSTCVNHALGESMDGGDEEGSRFKMIFIHIYFFLHNYLSFLNYLI